MAFLQLKHVLEINCVLNGVPSSELGRNALALTKLLGLGVALKGDGESSRTRCIRTLTPESKTYMYTHYYQIWYTTLQYTNYGS